MADTTDKSTSSSEILGSLEDLTDPTSNVAQLLDVGSAMLNFTEVLTRFLPQ